jgi:hypothetical protein
MNKMEIGSFIELDLPNTGEYHEVDYELNVARLNAARAGVYHALKLYGLNEIYLPYYLCPSVKKFLVSKGVTVKFYSLTPDLLPEIETNISNAAILLVNYFGLFSHQSMKELTQKFSTSIIDNCPGFYASPLENVYNVYSPRKFFGVPDGCYVIGNNAREGASNYAIDSSSETSNFLFRRIEDGCQNAYADRMLNEKRIDSSDILQMSGLTKAILSSVRYNEIGIIRRNNFQILHELIGHINEFDPMRFYDESCVPMVYPFVKTDSSLVDVLKEKGVYTGRWWNDVLNHVSEETIEAKFSNYMVPIPIDQRYGVDELKLIANTILESNG